MGKLILIGFLECWGLDITAQQLCESYMEMKQQDAIHAEEDKAARELLKQDPNYKEPTQRQLNQGWMYQDWIIQHKK